MTRSTFPTVRRISRGFSFVELLAVTGALFVIAATVTPAISNFIGRSKDVKLDQDIKVMNAAVSAYLTFGGHLDEDDTAATVVQKLKTRAVVAETDEVTGLSGQFIDPRIEIVMQNTLEADTDMRRAHWDTDSAKFVLATGGAKGIKRFRFSDDDVPLEDVEEGRETLMGYSSQPQSWVWDFQDRPKDGRVDLTIVATAGDTPSPLLPATAASDPLNLTPVPRSNNKLAKPTFSVPAGDYPITDFDIPVALNNPNPLGSSTLVYSINGGGWNDYVGGALPISWLTTLRARALPLDPHPRAHESYWIPSGVAHADYDGIHGSGGPLDPPTIGFSDPRFITGSVETVTVTLGNPNDPAISRVDYRLNGSNWQTYSGPFPVSQAFFPELTPVTVDAYTVATLPYWLDSAEVSDTIRASPAGAPPFALFCASELRAYGVTVLDGGKYKSNGVESGVDGDVAIAPGASWDFKSGAITGTFHTHPGTSGGGDGVDDTFGAGGDPVTQVTRDNSLLLQQALDMSASAAGMTTTQTFDKINSAMTIYATDPDHLNVISLNEVDINGGTLLTLHGGEDDFFVINVKKKIKMTGGSSWRVTGGLQRSRVLFNMLPGSDDFEGSGSSGEVTGGIILAAHPGTDVTLTGSSVIVGAVIGREDVEIKGGAQLFAASCNGD